MTEEYYLGKMDKIYSTMEKYEKKKKIMGLDKQEIIRYNKLVAEYLQLKLLLSDYIFQTYILPLALYGQASVLYHEFSGRIKWKTELLVQNDKMKVILQEYAEIDDKEAFKSRLEDYYVMLIDNFKDYYDHMEDKTAFNEICLLLSDGLDGTFDVILDYVDYIFEVLCVVLECEGDSDETISEESRLN
jgi:hypothetical protein